MSLIYMMQSNAEVFPNFSKEVSPFRDLIKKCTWLIEHDDAFKNVISKFRKGLLLSYFDMIKWTFTFTYAYQTGLDATLVQGRYMESSQSIAIASKTTNSAEKMIPTS